MIEMDRNLTGIGKCWKSYEMSRYHEISFQFLQAVSGGNKVILFVSALSSEPSWGHFSVLKEITKWQYLGSKAKTEEEKKIRKKLPLVWSLLASGLRFGHFGMSFRQKNYFCELVSCSQKTGEFLSWDEQLWKFLVMATENRLS